MKNLKKLIFLLFSLLVFNFSYSQEYLNIDDIKKEFEESNNKTVKKDFIMIYRGIGRTPDSPFELSSISGYSHKSFTTSMYFWNKDQTSEIQFPINDKFFDYEKFRRIIPEDHEDLNPKVIISTEVFLSKGKLEIFIIDIRLKD